MNTFMNRIIKTTMLKLLHTDIDKTRKKEIKRLLVFFDEVQEMDVHTINWSLQYSRNNQTYRMLISICYLVLKGLLQTTTDGRIKLMQSDIMLSQGFKILIIDAKYYENTTQVQYDKHTLHSNNLWIILGLPTEIEQNNMMCGW
ncbi:MAG: hypothetical protein Q4F98_06270 [Lachnospiraceae bacterium]|nr:hypothetical protein [Lachnospiraceae bacterium]